MTHLGMIIVSCIIEILLFYMLCHYIFAEMTCTNRKGYTVILMFIKILFNMIGEPSINIISSIIIYLFIAWRMYYGKFTFKVIIVFVYFTITMFSESFIFIITTDSLIEKYMVIRVILSKIITLFLILFIKSIKQLSNDNFTKKEIIILLLQPISLIAFMFITNGMVITDTNIKTLMAFGTLLLLISSVISFYNIEEIISKHRIENELKLRDEREKDSKEYYKELSNNIRAYKSLKHDCIKHISVIKILVLKEKYNEVLNYIDMLDQRVLKISDTRSGNEILDILLTSRMQLIRESHIEMIYEIKRVNLDWINLLDLTTILGNVLDNAIESCVLCDKRSIKIQMEEYNESYQIIKISNSCNNVKIDRKGDFISTKSNHEGIGIKNIRSALKSYDGSIKFDYSEKDKIFMTTIILKKSK